MNIRIGIVENENLYSIALQIILNNHPNMECVCAVQSVEDAITFLPHKNPDIILMDIDLGSGKKDGIDAIRELKSIIPSTLFLVITVFEDYNKVFEAIGAGALGYILKTSPPDKIIESILELQNGGSPMSPNIARLITQSFANITNLVVKDSYTNLLSKREKEILDMISNGKIEKEVADELFISVKTVKTHISNIYTKLQVHNRVDALNKYYGKFHS